MAAESDDLAYHQRWLEMLHQASAEGRRFSRVRVVSTPLTDYHRFAMWVAEFDREAGDDIRYLPRQRADDAQLPNHDYWLFDSRLLVRMHFDDADRFQGGEVVEDSAEIVLHNYWRDAARHYAVGRDDLAI